MSVNEFVRWMDASLRAESATLLKKIYFLKRNYTNSSKSYHRMIKTILLFRLLKFHYEYVAEI